MSKHWEMSLEDIIHNLRSGNLTREVVMQAAIELTRLRDIRNATVVLEQTGTINLPAQMAANFDLRDKTQRDVVRALGIHMLEHDLVKVDERRDTRELLTIFNVTALVVLPRAYDDLKPPGRRLSK